MKATIAMRVEHLMLSMLCIAATVLVASTMALMVTAHAPMQQLAHRAAVAVPSSSLSDL